MNGAEYLAARREHLPRALARLRPEFVVDNAGSDVLGSAEAHRREINQLNSQATDARHTAKAEGETLGHLTAQIETVREELKELKVQAADVRQAVKAEQETFARLKDRTAKEERQREWAKQQPAEPNKEAIRPAPTPAHYSIVGKWSATLDPDRGFVRECVFTSVKICSLDYYVGYRSLAGRPLRGVYRYDRERAMVTVCFPSRNLTQRLYWSDQDSSLCEDETGRILAFSRKR